MIAHCGTGIGLSALQAGMIPVLVTRRPEWREHVDDHQSQIAQFLGGRGLALIREVEHLTRGSQLRDQAASDEAHRSVAAVTAVGRLSPGWRSEWPAT